MNSPLFCDFEVEKSRKKDDLLHKSHLIKKTKHSGSLDSKKNLSTIDAPPGVPGVSKKSQKNATNKIVVLLH